MFAVCGRAVLTQLQFVKLDIAINFELDLSIFINAKCSIN